MWGMVAMMALASADEPKSGQICSLSKPLVVSTKPVGKGKITRLKKSEAFALITLRRKWSKVRVGDSDGFVRTSHMLERCSWTTPPIPDSSHDGEVAMAWEQQSARASTRPRG